MWTVTDETGNLLVHNTAVFEYDPVEDKSYTVTGPLNYDYSEWKIEIRYADDVAESSDITAPLVLLVEPTTNSNIKVEFSEEVEAESATLVSNYSLNNNIDVLEANMHGIVKSWVFLTVSPMEDGDYELNVSNVSDLAGNIMDPAVIPFSFLGVEEFINGTEVGIYPNPVTDVFNISLFGKESLSATVEISDLAGKVLYQQELQVNGGKNIRSVDITALHTGIYIIRIISGNESVERMIIKK
jgi:hypothetical protein